MNGVLNYGMRRLLGIIGALGLCLTARAEVKLFENNRWQGPIVISQNAELDEWYAAQNLADWCERVSGQRPEIFGESPNKKTPDVGVFVGRTQAALAGKISAPTGEGDTAIRATIEGRVFLLGNTPGATRIAVGRFCEQHLGITFTLPGIKGADWAPLKEVALPRSDTFQPKFNWRSIGEFRSGPTQDWCYLIGYGKAPQSGHSLYEAFSRKYTDAEPALLANLGNGRVSESNNEFTPNPNLSHPNAAKIGAAYVRNFLEKNSTEFCAPLSVNDTADFDRSSTNEGWYRERPVRTDYLINFLNRVAQEKWRPDDSAPHAIGTLAYLHTQRAPSIAANPDIFPFICADRIAYANRDFAMADAENLIAWKKSGVKHLGIYDYWHGTNQCVPRINFTAQALSIKTAADIGVSAWTAEMGRPWVVDAPKAWLGAKLLIDPSADAEGLLNQWFEAAYGPAAKSMREAYRVIEGAWSRDAINGGANQWLRHYVDEKGTWVLGDSEVALINQHLAEVSRALAKATSTPRLANQQWRAEQFKLNWEIVMSFREVVRARQPIAKTPDEAMACLQGLIAAEQKCKAQQESYNLAWGAVGDPINWMSFIPTDPRAAWLEIIGKNPGPSSEVSKLVRLDSTGLSVLIDFYQQHAASVATMSRPQDFTAFNQDWHVKLAGNQFSDTNYHEGLLQVNNDSGALTYKAAVKPGEIINLSVKLAQPSGATRLGLKFTGGEQSLKRSVQYGEQSTSVIMIAPNGSTGVEFEIVFTDNINLISLQASRLDPKANP